MGLEWNIRELRTGLVSNVGWGVSFPWSFSFYCALCSAKERETPGGRGESREGTIKRRLLGKQNMWKLHIYFSFLPVMNIWMDGIRKECLDFSRKG